MTFVDYLNKQGYCASSYIHEFIEKEVVIINGESILTRDLPKSKYAVLLRSYHFHNQL